MTEMAVDFKRTARSFCGGHPFNPLSMPFWSPEVVGALEGIQFKYVA